MTLLVKLVDVALASKKTPVHPVTSLDADAMKFLIEQLEKECKRVSDHYVGEQERRILSESVRDKLTFDLSLQTERLRQANAVIKVLAGMIKEGCEDSMTFEEEIRLLTGASLAEDTALEVVNKEQHDAEQKKIACA